MRPIIPAILLLTTMFFISCGGKNNNRGGTDSFDGEQKHFLASNIEDAVNHAKAHNGLINDTLSLAYPDLVAAYYAKNNFHPVWTDTSGFSPIADSLYEMIGRGLEWGLFPDDYKYPAMRSMHSLFRESSNREDPVLLTTTDVLFTDAFMRLAGELKQGRLHHDSLDWQLNRKKHDHFFIPALNRLVKSGKFSRVIDSLQPAYPEYHNLRGQIRGFLDSMDRKEYTYLKYPWKKNDSDDSLKFIRKLVTRLSESEIKYAGKGIPDSAALSEMIVEYQKKKGLKNTGLISSDLVNQMNTNDFERFRRLAVTLDRYKQMPEEMPEKYIWVNLPEYKLYVRSRDSLLLESRIICGTPGTPTPVLTSNINELVIFPTWTVPPGIIRSEILPGLKRNPGYLSRKGLYLLDKNGQRVNAASVNWSQYSKGIPYRVQQGSGVNNALGVIKFNFPSPYLIYLHDTNGRHLFKNSRRAMSHGCVRVQEWEKLAGIVIDNDSTKRQPADSFAGYKDSINTWISLRKKRTIQLKNHFPVFILYFGCGVQDGRLVFYEDIYRLDRDLRNQYFSDKRILPYM